MDRGLFATRDLAPGDLLFVSSPITTAMHPKGGGMSSKVTSKLIGNLKKMVKYARENLKDFSQVHFLVQLDALAGPYPSGPLPRDTPPMRYFTPVNAIPENLRKVDTDQEEENLVIRTEFDEATLLDILLRRRETIWMQPGMSMANADGTGIFCLPSLINHSCLPNAAMITCGTAEGVISKVVRAARKVKKGEELFSSYHEVFCPLKDRRALPIELLTCECERCVWEEKLIGGVPGFRKLQRTCGRLWQRRAGLMYQSLGRRAEMRQQCIESIKTLGEFFVNNPKLRLTVDAVRVMNPVSNYAMAISSEAFRQVILWKKKPWSSSNSEFKDLIGELAGHGMDIAQLLYGRELDLETLRDFFGGAWSYLRLQPT
ncbi:hypothetical protein R1flu_000344 [Riccia fluitans]|uniref:SET domain-containing protein n=1 Tax=Riccia fluitans TaxID=41844 RepID=A0ABD1Y148_9MARC